MTDVTEQPKESLWQILARQFVERVIISHKSTLLFWFLGGCIVLADQLAQAIVGWHSPYAVLAGTVVGLIGTMLRNATAVAQANAEKEAAKQAKLAAAPKPDAGFVVLSLLLALALVSAVLAPSFARADGFLVHCFSGCPQKALKAGPVGGALDSDVAISSTMWVGPGIGAPPFLYDGATKEWKVMASPVLSYGLWWRPPGWTATKSLLGVNLAVTGELFGAGQSHIDPILTINLIDNIQIGGGVKARFATPTQAGGLSPIFAVYWSTSIGGP